MEFWKSVLMHYVAVVVSGGICHIFHGKIFQASVALYLSPVYLSMINAAKKTPKALTLI